MRNVSWLDKEIEEMLGFSGVNHTWLIRARWTVNWFACKKIFYEG